MNQWLSLKCWVALPRHAISVAPKIPAQDLARNKEHSPDGYDIAGLLAVKRRKVRFDAPLLWVRFSPEIANPVGQSGKLLSPGPRGRSIRMLSTQRPNLKPTEGMKPHVLNP